ncbi:alpha-tocopherol transfer protein-like [Onthophagus taurus]|uniref:alpha-tocopherol transfer protein-like n=1 Tax=Onthophagus taurus TaxID=166361 RepID=UPI0039BE4787
MELLCPPDIFQEGKIREELGEDKDRLINKLKLLKEWIQYNSYLPQGYDETILTTFLRGCKHDLEKTKKKIQTYFIACCTNSEFLGNRIGSLNDDMKATEFISAVMMPRLTPEGYRVIIIKLTDSNVDRFDLVKTYRYISRIADIKVHEDTLIAGEVFVIDASLATTEILAKFLSNTTKKAISLALDMYPVRIKSIHVISSIPFIQNILIVLKTVIKDKLIKRFYFHKSVDKLCDFVPLKCLPGDYGGPQRPLKEINEDWKGKVVGFREKYLQMGGEMRLNGPVPHEFKKVSGDVETEFGVQGSFRKLNLD